MRDHTKYPNSRIAVIKNITKEQIQQNHVGIHAILNEFAKCKTTDLPLLEKYYVSLSNKIVQFFNICYKN